MTAPNNDDKVEHIDISALNDTLGPVMADPIIIDRLSALGCELVVYPDHDTYVRHGNIGHANACSNRRKLDGVFQICVPAANRDRLDILLHEIGHLVDFAYGVFAMGKETHFTAHHAFWHETYYKAIRNDDPEAEQRANLHEAFAEFFCGLQAKPWGDVFLRNAKMVMLVNIVADVTEQFIKQSEGWAQQLQSRT